MDEITGLLEYEFIVVPLGVPLKAPSPDRIYNTDEKPLQLSFTGTRTITFGDIQAPTFVPQESRSLNTTLVLTSRSDGTISRVTVIFPSLPEKAKSAMCDVLKKYPAIPIEISETESGFVNKEIYSHHLIKLFTECIPKGSSEAPLLHFHDAHSSQSAFSVLRELMAKMAQYNVHCSFIQSHMSTWSQSNDLGVNFMTEAIFREETQNFLAKKRINEGPGARLSIIDHLEIICETLTQLAMKKKEITRAYKKTGNFIQMNFQ